MLKIIKNALIASLPLLVSLHADAVQLKTTKSENPYIPYEQFTLPNGLRVIVHTDRKAPIVAVNIWYHVGSKDEPQGRSGFAHLFEHLMFQGSENHKEEYFTPFHKIGVTDQNGTTNNDRTNYFQNVPSSALDTALFMESDRMGHMLGAIDQKTLDEQRGVVQNEKRQGENRPYGQAWNLLNKELYEKGTPYHHSVIGSMNDLNAASLDDVKNWFKSWYGPNNAVLVLAGDIDVETAKQKVLAYFGDIPATATPEVKKPYVERRTKQTRSETTDNVAQPLLLKSWRVAHAMNKDSIYLNLVADILGGNETSRLVQRLSLKEQLVDEISANSYGMELSGSFTIRALVKKGVEIAKVETIIQEEVDAFLKNGPTVEELNQIKAMKRANFVRSLERIGGFGGKSDVLARCAVFEKDPSCFEKNQNIRQNASIADLQNVAKNWLTKSDHTLIIKSGKQIPIVEAPAVKVKNNKIPTADKKWKTVASTIDRSKGVPMPESFPLFKFPTPQQATLANGMKLTLIERKGSPIIDVSLVMQKGGYAYDTEQFSGLANLAMSMMTEGTQSLDKVAFAKKTDMLGMQVSANTYIDNTQLAFSAPLENIEPSLELFFDMVQNPKFDQSEVERVKSQILSELQVKKRTAADVADRVLSMVQFEEGHPYRTPKIGFENSIQTLKRDDLIRYHKQNFTPAQSQLVIVGDITLAKINTILNQQTRSFVAADQEKPQVISFADSVSNPKEPLVYLVDIPNAVQSMIVGSQLLPNFKEIEKNIAYDALINILGGSFTARINLNLREDKHWSYGSYATLDHVNGPRQFATSAPVQTDKTAEAVIELIKEIRGLTQLEKPISNDELNRIKAKEKLALPGRFETNTNIAMEIVSSIRLQRPLDYVEKRVSIMDAYTPTLLQPVAKDLLNTQNFVWVIAGDVNKIRPTIEKLQIGKVQVVDADGKVKM